MRNILKKPITKIILIAIAVAVTFVVAVNLYVVLSTCGKIRSHDEKADEKYDAILVLGAGITKDGKPKGMLEDRLRTAFEAYENGYADKIIVSGDHRFDSHDEVTVMKKYLVGLGVPSESIYKDHLGLSTVESVVRAKEIFGVGRIAVVTQRYHLHRALFLAKSRGLECVGINASLRNYVKQPIYSAREVLARIKDFFGALVKNDPDYTDAFIGLEVSGDLTDEK